MLEDQNYQVLGHQHDISIAYGAAQLTVEVLCKCNKSRLAPYCPISGEIGEIK
jgi:CDGSH-type Zn-finger protein